MNNDLNEEALMHIVARLLERAKEAAETHKKEKTEHSGGEQVAYYAMLDIIQSELDARDIDLKKYSLDIDLLKTLF